ncbi:MAG: DUF459 domain-containing protein [Candidatus Nanopelagicales bacterium]
MASTTSEDEQRALSNADSSTAPAGRATQRAERMDRESVGHRALEDSRAPTAPAGKALFIVMIALTFALIFDSAGALHMALGMKPGPVKSVSVGVLRPWNSLAHTVWLDRPKLALDRLFGHEADATEGAGLADGNDGILDVGRSTAGGEQSNGLAATKQEPGIVSPTTADPLRVLVLGDSLSTFVGQQLDDISTERNLVKVKQVFKDGTGINSPEFFNWQAAALSEARESQAQAVVFVIGGNDAQDMTHDGKTLRPRTHEWETEYARRVAVIMQALIDQGVQRVYWSGPPVARSKSWDASYRRINQAIPRAAAAIPGSRYVDLYRTRADEPTYSDYATIDGKQVKARQPDGIHWTYGGSREPAELIANALQADYGRVL